MIKKSSLIIIFAVLVSILPGCATGTKFQNVNFEQKKSAIYIYRSASPFGIIAVLPIICDGEELGALKSGGYFYKIVDPGLRTVSSITEVREAVTIDVEPNKSYFVKANTSTGLMVARPELTLIEPEKGIAAIKNCKLQKRYQ